MSLSPSDTGRILQETIFPFLRLDTEETASYIVAIQKTCGWLRVDVFEQACTEVAKSMRNGRKPAPGEILGHARNIMGQDSSGESGKVQPQTPEEIKTWSLLEIAKLSPRTCKELCRQIDAKQGLAKFAKWDDDVLRGLMQKAGEAQDEPAPEEVEKPKLSISKAIEIVKEKLIDYVP